MRHLFADAAVTFFTLSIGVFVAFLGAMGYLLLRGVFGVNSGP